MKIIIVANSPKKSFKEMYHLNPSDYFIGLDGKNGLYSTGDRNKL